jgi:hypothetical protein
MPKKGFYEDLSQKRFGKLLVIEYDGQNGRRRTIWKCQCDCGNIVSVSACHLKSGHTKSCGCVKKEISSQINYKNGLSQTRLWRAYRNMLNRCYYKKYNEYHLYGGRGISVCDEWNNKECGFINFCDWALSNGYTEELTLDRVDNDGNYEPSNCRWVDRFIQANNKRNTRKLIINGEIDTVANWSRRLSVSYWNLLNYSKGGKNYKYPNLNIEVIKNEPN